MIQSKWGWPYVIVFSGVLAGSLSLTNSTIWLRPLAGLWFLLVCPGMAFVRLLPIKERMVRWTLAVALSLALDALVASILVYARLWSANVALVILIGASLAGVSLQLIPIRWPVLKKPVINLLGFDEGHWYLKVISVISRLMTNLKSSISSTTIAVKQMSSNALMTSKVKILLVDRDPAFSASVCNILQASGYRMLCAQSGDEALNIVVEAKPDLILLDIQLPGTYGWDAMHRLREISSKPIIVLITEYEEADILHGFHLGADDYMTKPSSFSKLETRVAAILSRSRVIHATKEFVKSDELAINFMRKQVKVNRQKINLTTNEYRLLESLARHANRTIPLSRLQAEVFGSSYEGNKQLIRKFIQSLRKKVEADPRQPKHIITRRGYGYRFE